MGVKRNDGFYKNLLLLCVFLDYVVILMLYFERMFLTCPGYKEMFLSLFKSVSILNGRFIFMMFLMSLFLAMFFLLLYYSINYVILFFLKSSDVDSYKLILSILISFSVSLLFAFCILSFTVLKPDYLIFKLLVGFSSPLIMTVLFNDAFYKKRDFYLYSLVIFFVGFLFFLIEIQIFKI
jgi:hypothetical protein